MDDRPPPPRFPLRIQEPCPKRWAELEGGGSKRFCSACALHVHDAGQLTRDEARALVAASETRVCMRIPFDERGTPVFRDSAPASRPGPRLARRVLSALAGVLAACHGSLTGTPVDGPPPGGGEPPSRMGKVVAPEMLGEVALPHEPSEASSEATSEAPSEAMGGIALEPETPAPDEE